jgi:hypothetical protein
MKVTALLCFIVVALVARRPLPSAPANAAASPAAEELRQRVKSAKDAWAELFRSSGIRKGSSLKDVETLMGGRYRFKGTEHLSGLGDFIVYYRIDDFVELGVLFDVNKTVQSVLAPTEPSRWLMHPEGRIWMRVEN